MIVRLVAGFRVSFDIGNYPVSTMFSYVQVNDGEFHTVELSITGALLACAFVISQCARVHRRTVMYCYVHKTCARGSVNLIWTQ